MTRTSSKLEVLNESESPDNNAICELRDELKDLNATIKKANVDTERFTMVLIFLAIIQVVVAVFSFLVALDTIKDPFLRWTFIISFGFMFIYVIREFGRRISK